MTEKEIYDKVKNTIGIERMTGNERLWASGLMDELDKTINSDPPKARIILKALKFDNASSEKILGTNSENFNNSNPWNFPEETFNGLENENKASVKYYCLGEIAMGAPLGGRCMLITNGNNEILIEKWCGGQPLWNSQGTKVAIPIWEKSFFRGTIQKLGILDLKSNTLTKYKKKFDVLELKKFNGNIIKLKDSPIYKTKYLEFDTKKEKIELIKNLKN